MVSNEPENINDNGTVKQPNIFKARWFGVTVILILLGFIILWAVFSRLESAAIAPGKIIVAGYNRVLQHLEGGIIESINVKEGSKVNKGQLLVKLDDTQAKAAAQIAQTRIFELLAQEARLKSEMYTDPQVKYPTQLLTHQANPKVKEIITSQNTIFTANRETFLSKIDILQQRIKQLNDQIDALQSQHQAYSRQLQLIRKEVKSVAYLEARKLIEKPRLLALQREEARLKGKQGETLATIASLKQKIGETKLQIATEKKANYREIVTDLRETQQKLGDALEKQKSTQDILQRTSIRAPLTGSVVGLTIHTRGGVIKPGEVLMNIVPSQESLVIEARVKPLDIDVVRPGLVAKVRLTSFKARQTPTLLGEVTQVSADALTDQQSSDSYYRARITIPAKQLRKLKGQKLQPGMPAQVMIITDKLTPWQYITSPITSSFSKAFREQ